jgi:hypothetical protein
MKLRVYKIAALACLMAVGVKSNAQQSSSSSSSSSAPAPAQAPAIALTPGAFYSYTAPMALYSTDNLSSFHFEPMDLATMEVPGMMQDSAYRKKMRKLQEDMRELQKQMSTLRTEEMKKNGEELRKRYEGQNKVYADAFKNFDKTFSAKFQNFGQNMRFNFERSDADMDKKVQSGEVKMKTKNFTKTYTVDGDDKLQIDNRFGKITVNTWAKNEFKVDVEIKAYANEDADAQKLLDQVSITDKKDNSVIGFTTVIGDNDHKNTFWGTWTTNGKTTVRKTVINYIVYMPAKSPLTITNRYGGTVLPDLYGKLNINNSYGNLSAKSLTNAANVISVKYGSADIENLVGSDLDVAYGNLNLTSADKLNADVSYGSAKIGKLNASGTINVKYGGLQIIGLDKALKSLSVNSSYSPVKLGALGNADFDVTVHYGGFTYDDGSVNVVTKTPTDDNRSWTSTKTYKGHVGKGSNDKVIVIKSNYSSVKFDQ